ncbi:hypothetical protein F0562_024015 [Nyssa sinensis]|uniref:Uncharacterized protein n=1 Tax=Nyssa sinensis TaxID=561372 RepID=A0A5J5BI64_9ASTE|nr:hypothetical protein F0562_024015 [Nyssa sinensis]
MVKSQVTLNCFGKRLLMEDSFGMWLQWLSTFCYLIFVQLFEEIVDRSQLLGLLWLQMDYFNTFGSYFL